MASDVRIAPLPYRADTTALFEAVVDEPWSMLLDSGAAGRVRGRYDIIVAAPSVTLTTRGGETTIERANGSERSSADPFALIRTELGPRCEPPPYGLPFAGGALGYFGYDLARRIERLPSLADDLEDIPEMAVGIYDWAVVVDHDTETSYLIASDGDRIGTERWEALVERFGNSPAALARAPFCVRGEARANFDAAGYRAAFERAHSYLRAGDCYQVNLAQRFEVAASGDPWVAFRRLRAINPAPFAAYLHVPGVQVLSVSPERFLRAEADGHVETRPIKGTRPRNSDATADAALADALATSPKDRAENVMIVDLLRNDLGRVCANGSVRVPKLCEIESFPTVHHLVSTVTGELASGNDALDLLRACFPGGSITGAPKIRAMEIIEELEPHRRGVYCGAIGYVGFDGAMDTNIAIRTLVHSHDRARFWAGGGIVIDSEAESEYQETFDKAAAMLALLREVADDPSPD